MDIRQSTTRYEAWLRSRLRGDVVAKDLKAKHDKMKQSAFVFLRATYWRWAEIICDVCPDLADAPEVLSVGDIHVENFGTWRDVDGRMVWGINDFDEAAEMPYVLDLVRLSASALLARGGKRADPASVCDAIVEGYRKGLRDPKPFVLDRGHRRMRELLVVPEGERARFWKRIDGERKAGAGKPGRRYREALASAMPVAGMQMVAWPRTAGTGSLGRPRWVALAEWQGGPVVREARAAVPSAWGRACGRGAGTISIMKIARGKYRAPDPWYRLTRDNVIVRRLYPSTRKIEMGRNATALLEARMLEAMGRELASVHLGVADCSAALLRDLKARKRGWLVRAVAKAADATRDEFEQWERG